MIDLTINWETKVENETHTQTHTKGNTTQQRSNTDMNTDTMDLQYKTHVSTSCRVAPPVQGPTPRLNMAIVQLNTGDENLRGGGEE